VVVLDDVDLVSVNMVLEVSPVDVHSEVLVVPSAEGGGNLLLEILLGILIRLIKEAHHLLLVLSRELHCFVVSA